MLLPEPQRLPEGSAKNPTWQAADVPILRSCQRQANSLRKWLELSQQEPSTEDHDAEQQMQKELEEVELQIQQLSVELQAQRQPVRSCIARIQALQQVLR